MSQGRKLNPPDGPTPARGRWIEGSDGDRPEDRAGALFRAALRRAPLEAERLSAIGERLRVSTRRARPRPRRAWQVAVAFGLMLSGSALTAAANWYLHRLRAADAVPPQVAPLAPPSVPPKPRIRRGSALVPPTPGDEALAIPDDPPAPPDRAAQVRHRPAGPSLPLSAESADPIAPASPSMPTASALSEESALLTTALRKLRQDDDAGGALASLDEHDVRFGRGTLAPEATLARIEALVKLHRNAEALSLLDGMAPAPAGLGRDLLIARAELRAAAGRCAMAGQDFDLLLDGEPAFDSIAERALWGRASCRAGDTDAAGARDDLRSYLFHFPHGRFAGDARAALER
jgi:hypothetical protein